MDAAIVEKTAVLVPLMAIAADWRSGSRRMPPSSKIRRSAIQDDARLIPLTALVEDSELEDWRSGSRRMPPSSKIGRLEDSAVMDAAIVEDSELSTIENSDWRSERKRRSKILSGSGSSHGHSSRLAVCNPG